MFTLRKRQKKIIYHAGAWQGNFGDSILHKSIHSALSQRSRYKIEFRNINCQRTEFTKDPSIKTESERCKYFGQASHVRMYSKQGFVQRLEHSGFKVNQFGISYFGAEIFEKCGIHPRSVLYVVEKTC